MISIPKNTYVPPTEVREEVVQAICEAFLFQIIHDGYETGGIYHPNNEGTYRSATRYVKLRDKHGLWFTWDPNREREMHPEQYVKFNAAEMRRAFKELRNAGYHMLQVRQYGTWKGYMCSVKPYDTWQCFEKEVFDFTDQID